MHTWYHLFISKILREKIWTKIRPPKKWCYRRKKIVVRTVKVVWSMRQRGFGPPVSSPKTFVPRLHSCPYSPRGTDVSSLVSCRYLCRNAQPFRRLWCWKSLIYFCIEEKVAYLVELLVVDETDGCDSTSCLMPWFLCSTDVAARINSWSFLIWKLPELSTKLSNMCREKYRIAPVSVSATVPVRVKPIIVGTFNFWRLDKSKTFCVKPGKWRHNMYYFSDRALSLAAPQSVQWYSAWFSWLYLRLN